MKPNSKTYKKVAEAFDAIESVEEVKVSPFFKEKVMQQIRSASKEKEVISYSWFTPSLQCATLILLMFLNVYTYKVLTSNDYNTTVEEFVDTYDFSEETYTSIFN